MTLKVYTQGQTIYQFLLSISNGENVQMTLRRKVIQCHHLSTTLPINTTYMISLILCDF